ncbi:hypothetical protein [Lysobacter terrae]
MGYRIEFRTQGGDAGVIASTLDDSRFPTFVQAVAAVRAEVLNWARARSPEVVVNIFDQRDHLASRLQLAVPTSGSVRG